MKNQEIDIPEDDEDLDEIINAVTVDGITDYGYFEDVVPELAKELKQLRNFYRQHRK